MPANSWLIKSLHVLIRELICCRKKKKERKRLVYSILMIVSCYCWYKSTGKNIPEYVFTLTCAHVKISLKYIDRNDRIGLKYENIFIIKSKKLFAKEIMSHLPGLHKYLLIFIYYSTPYFRNRCYLLPIWVTSHFRMKFLFPMSIYSHVIRDPSQFIFGCFLCSWRLTSGPVHANTVVNYWMITLSLWLTFI